MNAYDGYRSAVLTAENIEQLDDYLRYMIHDQGYTEDAVPWLTQIHAAVHRPVKAIAKAAGMPQYRLAEYFCIPRRTMEDWCRGIYKCPTYTRLMMQEVLGLLKRDP